MKRPCGWRELELQQLSPSLQGLLRRCTAPRSPKRREACTGQPSTCWLCDVGQGPDLSKPPCRQLPSGQVSGTPRRGGACVHSRAAWRADSWWPSAVRHQRVCSVFYPPPMKAAGKGAGDPKLPVQRTVPGVRQKGPGRGAQVGVQGFSCSKRGKSASWKGDQRLRES